MSKLVAIVGRPNVGKSTLYNRLVGERSSIVGEEVGITRDRHYGISDWSGRTFTVIDMGGFTTFDGTDTMAHKIGEQIEIAVSEADVILLVVDCKAGLLEEDLALVDYLRKHKKDKPVLVVANKADNAMLSFDMHRFHQIGLGEIYPISATHGSGTGDMLDALVALLPEGDPVPLEDIPRVAFIGRPNVGKSTFINTLLGKQRHVVDAVSHTTRTPANSHYRLYQKELILTDTAGISKKRQTESNSLEFYALIRSIKAIESSDVCVLLIKAQDGLTTQDQNILSLAYRKKKGIVMLINQWDLMPKGRDNTQVYRTVLQNELAYINHLPLLFTSGKEKKNILQTIEKVLEVYAEKKKKIPTSKLNKSIHHAIEHNPLPRPKGQRIKIGYAVQLPGNHPIFCFFSNAPQYIPTNYKRYLAKRIRAEFSFQGVPISLVFKKK